MDVMGRFIYILVDVYNRAQYRAHNHHVWLMYMDVDVIDMLGIQTTGPQTTNSPLVDQLIQKQTSNWIIYCRFIQGFGKTNATYD